MAATIAARGADMLSRWLRTNADFLAVGKIHSRGQDDLVAVFDA
jgi:hypothetical protein